jgi:tetratricopeptide (TPR) repeat protein
MLGELDAADNLRVLLHLLPGCSRCRAVTADLWRVGAEPEGGPSWSRSRRFQYQEMVDRVFASVRQAQGLLVAERAAAPQLLDELMAHPAGLRPLLARNDPRFRTWGLAELLLRACHDRRFESPHEAAELADLAVAVTEGDLPLYPPVLAEDLRARAWGALANAKRILADFRSAELAFRWAETHRARGTGDRIEKARLLDLQASLRDAQGRSEEAARLLDRAIAIYRRAGEWYLLGRTLVQKGNVLAGAGENEAALAALWQGLELMTGNDPQMELNAWHNMTYLLTQMGRHAEALELLERNRPLYAEHGSSLHQIRLRYLEGEIAAGFGHLEAAETAFAEVRQTFLDQGRPLDAGLACLELARVHALRGRMAEVRALSREALGVFRSLDLPRETLASLILFEKAAEAETVTLNLLREVSVAVTRAAGR